MEKKIIVILEILFIVIASGYYLIKVVIPEYKEKYGSSDSLINTNIYTNMYEFNIDNSIDFALVLDMNNQVYHIMFFSQEATCLYNKNIEDSEVDVALLDVVKILIENKYLNVNSNIKIVRYNDYYHNEFINSLKSVLNKYNINTNILEEVSSLENKANELGIEGYSIDSILKNIDYYSKEYNRVNNNKNTSITSDNVKEYTDNIYEQISNFVMKNNITDLDKNNNELIIKLLSYNGKNIYYPSDNSWYYVVNGKVYAYIEFLINNNKYGYCYNGSIDIVSKGECINEEEN